MVRPDEASRDMSQPAASADNGDESNIRSEEKSAEQEDLRQKNMSLEIDKKVRDGLIDQLKNDRKEILLQLQHHVETITTQSRMIGQLETRLELTAPEPVRKLRVYESADQDVNLGEGDRHSENVSPDGI
jgi:hypothetical protein